MKKALHRPRACRSVFYRARCSIFPRRMLEARKCAALSRVLVAYSASRVPQPEEGSGHWSILHPDDGHAAKMPGSDSRQIPPWEKVSFMGCTVLFMQGFQGIDHAFGFTQLRERKDQQSGYRPEITAAQERIPFRKKSWAPFEACLDIFARHNRLPPKRGQRKRV